MARFKDNQEIVCRDGDWIVVEDNDTTCTPDPKAGQIVKVERYITETHLLLYGFQSAYDEESFEPLMDITELTEILESQPAEV